MDHLRKDHRGPEGPAPASYGAQSVAPSALKLWDASDPRSRTGLLNAAASRLVEWFHSTPHQILPEATSNLARSHIKFCQKNKKLSVCCKETTEIAQRELRKHFPGGLRDLHIHDLISSGSDAGGMLTHYNRLCRYGNCVLQPAGCLGHSAPGT